MAISIAPGQLLRTGGVADTESLVFDSFDRADSTTSLGTADTGQTWVALEGTMGISTNKAYVASGPTGSAHLDSGAADVDVTCDVTHDGDNGLIFRSFDWKNFMLARLGSNEVLLHRREAGTFTLVASAAMTLTVGQVYALRVVASGSTIDVYVDGMKKITATDSFQSTLTKHGLYGVGSAPRWDNFQVDAA